MPYGPPYTVVFQIQLPKNSLGTSQHSLEVSDYQLEKITSRSCNELMFPSYSLRLRKLLEVIE